MANDKAYICGMGAVTPVGLDAQQTAASVRAGLSRNMESIHYDKHFEPFVLSMLPDEALPELVADLEKAIGLTSRQIRLLRLATLAITEALSDIQDTGNIPLLLGCPEPIPGKEPVVTDDFISKLTQQTGISLDLSNSEIFPQGRASGLIALEKAIAKVENGAPYVLVGGVDTYQDLYVLGTLDLENRILGSRVMDGFIPGEGAGFILVGNRSPSGQAPLQLMAAAQGFEKGHLYSEESYQGDGLSEAMQMMFEKIPDCPKIKSVYAGLNGENFGAKEWGVGSLRNADRFKKKIKLEHPIDCMGDPGAALGPLLTILAAIGLQKEYVEGPCLAWCSSDHGSRAAAVIDKE